MTVFIGEILVRLRTWLYLSQISFNYIFDKLCDTYID